MRLAPGLRMDALSMVLLIGLAPDVEGWYIHFVFLRNMK